RCQPLYDPLVALVFSQTQFTTKNEPWLLPWLVFSGLCETAPLRCGNCRAHRHAGTRQTTAYPAKGANRSHAPAEKPSHVTHPPRKIASCSREIRSRIPGRMMGRYPCTYDRFMTKENDGNTRIRLKYRIFKFKMATEFLDTESKIKIIDKKTGKIRENMTGV
ncbi:MAG: hypothetical protein AAGU74_10345, partial [Bacillota bacterium]